jgi:hypothetical protein
VRSVRDVSNFWEPSIAAVIGKDGHIAEVNMRLEDGRGIDAVVLLPARADLKIVAGETFRWQVKREDNTHSLPQARHPHYNNIYVIRF